MRNLKALAFVAIAAIATNAWALGEARLTGKVVDAEGKPLEGVVITMMATEGKNTTLSFTTKKNGEYSLFVIEGKFPYKVTYAKPGYATFEETIQLKLAPERNIKNVTLLSGAAAAPTTTVEAPAAADPAAVAYNEGAELANSGKTAEAIARFEEAVKINPELTAGYMTLTKLYAREKNWNQVVSRGNKALEVVSDDEDMITLVADAYDKLGEKTKASELRSKAPKDANALFNEAAKLINAGKASQAEPLLKQAVEIDPEFAQAYYELGMLYAGMSKNTDAKANLNKYLELEPNGKDAATAREMINYMK